MKGKKEGVVVVERNSTACDQREEISFQEMGKKLRAEGSGGI